MKKATPKPVRAGRTTKSQTVRPKPDKTASFQAMARAAAARASVIPDLTDLIDADEEVAMIEAYIDQHCADDSKQELHAAAKADREGDGTSPSPDIVWIREEIAFALGVEIGRRLFGGGSVSYAAENLDPYHWKCDEPSRTGGAK